MCFASHRTHAYNQSQTGSSLPHPYFEHVVNLKLNSLARMPYPAMSLPNLTHLHLFFESWTAFGTPEGTYSEVFYSFSDLLPVLNPTHLALDFQGTVESDEHFQEVVDTQS